MLLIALLVLSVSFLELGAAQSSSSTSTSSASAPTHSISVGAEGLSFTPNQLTASVGDVLEFRFYPQNHSVARADFKSPCIPYEDTGINRQGFWSGFRPVALVLSDPPIFQVTVNDTDPIFFYCSAPGACINDGMIGVINANSTETFDTQLAYAKNSTLMFSPGQYFPSEIVPTPSPTSSTSPTSTSTQTSSSTAVPAASSKALSNGAIAGVAIGGSAVLLIAATLLYLCGRQRTMGELIKHNQNPPVSYIPGHLSLSSNGTFSPKIPQSNIDSLTPGRYSGAGPLYTRSPAGTESYRSQSPPIDETSEFMIPPLNLAGSPRSVSPLQSPLVGRPMADSPTYPMSMSPVTPINETMYQTYQPLNNIAISPLRIQRFNSQHGPHELSADLESGTGTMQSRQQEFRDEKSSNTWQTGGPG